MNQNLTETEQFLLWFAGLKAVSAQKRQQFLKQVEAVGGIDQEGIAFLEAEFKQIDDLSQKRLKAWNDLKLSLSNAQALQKEPRYNLVQQLSDRVCYWMAEKAQTFKNFVRQTDAKQAQSEENLEAKEEMAQVAALKASL